MAQPEELADGRARLLAASGGPGLLLSGMMLSGLLLSLVGVTLGQDVLTLPPSATPWLIGGLMAGWTLTWTWLVRRWLSRTERSSSQPEHNLARAFLMNPDPSIVTRIRDGVLVEVNEAYIRLSGYTRAEMLGKTSVEIGVWADQEERHAFWDEVQRHGSVRDREGGFRSKQGKIYTVAMSADVIEWEGEACLLSMCRDITERKAYEASIKRSEERLAYLAQYDTLTGLPNRALFRDRLNHALAGADRHQTKVALLFLDLDHFKLINDTYGHTAGDSVLLIFSERVRQALRESDTLARLGGDEFIVIVENVARDDDLERIAQHVLQAGSRTIQLPQGPEVSPSVSVGLAVYPQDAADAESLLSAADLAMYRAKAEGRNNTQRYHPDLSRHLAKRVSMQHQLRMGLERGEFSLHFQPQVDLAERRVVGLEALLRWHNAELGSVSPGEFIPVAEECGLIVPLGEWVLRQAVQQARAWQQAGMVNCRMAVNVSAAQFRHPYLLDMVGQVLQDTGLEPHYLELEVTESMLMSHMAVSAEILRALKALGVRVSVDDFGTGYSSLSYLSHFPLDVLKIDRTFVQQVDNSKADAAIVSAIMALSNSLGVDVVAEGIETERQLEALRGHGCHTGQGYLLARPQAAAEIHALLMQQGLFAAQSPEKNHVKLEKNTVTI